MQYDFTLLAGGGMDVNAVGNFIKYKSGLGAIRIRLNTGGYVDLTPGQGIRVKTDFSAFNIADRSGNANIGIVLAGPFEFQDDSIAGTVSVVDGAKASTLSQSCFMGTVNAGTAAGFVNGAGLVNPGGNTKNVVVESVEVMLLTAGIMTMHHSSFTAGVVGNAYNKMMFAGPQSTAGLSSNPGNNVAAFGSIVWKRNMGSNTVVGLKFAEPLILPPGRSLQIVHNTVASDLVANFEFREDPV
jgi:hypothetical protein